MTLPRILSAFILAVSTIAYSQSNLASVASDTITRNSSSFADSTPYIRAAPAYAYEYIADLTLTDLAMPSLISDDTVLNAINKFLARTNYKGEIPISISADFGTVQFYSGLDNYHAHATPDGAFALPLLEQDYYKRQQAKGISQAGAIFQFVMDAPKLSAALNALAIDTVTNCPKIVAGDERASWGFQDDVRFTGAVSIDCVFFAHAAQVMGQMYGLANNAAAATVWNSKYTKAMIGLNASSPLWDSTNGMLVGATGQNSSNINIYASVLAVHWNLLTPAQSTAVCNWIGANIASITYKGFIRQSPTIWAYSGVLYGGFPYDFHFTSNQYDNAYWSHFFRETIECLMVSNPTAAKQLMADFLATPDPTIEWTSPSGGTGFTGNLITPMGPLAALSLLDITDPPPPVVTPPVTTGDEEDFGLSGTSDESNPQTFNPNKPLSVFVLWGPVSFILPPGTPGQRTSIAFCNVPSGPYPVTPPPNVTGFVSTGLPNHCTVYSFIMSSASNGWYTTAYVQN